MTTITFDTHEFIKELKKVGFSEEQAEAITHLQKQAVAATLDQAKHEFELDEVSSKRDMKEFELRMDARFKDTELKIAETKSELIRWVVGVGLLQTTLIAALLLKLVGTP